MSVLYYTSESDRIVRSRSNELRGRILDIIQRSEVKVLTKNGEVPSGKVLPDIPKAIQAVVQASPDGLPDPQVVSILNSSGFSLILICGECGIPMSARPRWKAR